MARKPSTQKPQVEITAGVFRERKQDRLRELYQAGAEAAQSYGIGDFYIGAWGEADRIGLTQIDERVAFVEGFLAHQPLQLTFDAEGKIAHMIRRENDA